MSASAFERWSTDLPKEEGFYWFRATGDFHPYRSTQLQVPAVVLVHIDRRTHLEDTLCVRFFTGTFTVEQATGEWAGPIPAPKEPV